MPMLDVRKLVLLAEVVEAGSITAAATALNCTPYWTTPPCWSYRTTTRPHGAAASP